MRTETQTIEQRLLELAEALRGRTWPARDAASYTTLDWRFVALCDPQTIANLCRVVEAARGEYKAVNGLFELRDRIPNPGMDDLMEIDRAEAFASQAHAELWGVLRELDNATVQHSGNHGGKCWPGDREDCMTTPEATRKRVWRIAANFPRVNSLAISTHDAAYVDWLLGEWEATFPGRSAQDVVALLPKGKNRTSAPESVKK